MLFLSLKAAIRCPKRILKYSLKKFNSYFDEKSYISSMKIYVWRRWILHIYWLKLKGFFRLRASLKSIAYRMSIKFWRKSQYFSTLPRILNLSIINIHYYANQMVCFAFLINAILWYENYFRQQNSNINYFLQIFSDFFLDFRSVESVSRYSSLFEPLPSGFRNS